MELPLGSGSIQVIRAGPCSDLSPSIKLGMHAGLHLFMLEAFMKLNAFKVTAI
jgi:hypothetical protein